MIRAESRCRVCLCLCTDEEHALTEEQADALLLDAATAVVCLDCLRGIYAARDQRDARRLDAEVSL